MRIVNGFIKKKVLWVIAAIIIPTSGNAQIVRNESGNINATKFHGFSVIINDTRDKVLDFWVEYAGEMAKLRRKRDFYQMEEFKLPEAFYPEAMYYVRINEKDSLGKIWIALDPGTLLAGEEGEELVNTALRTFMEKLPAAYQKELIRKRIREAEQAIAFTEKQQRTLVHDGETFEGQLQHATNERERMLKMLERLELEILALNQRIENTRVQIEQINTDLEKMKFVVKKYQEELNKIH